MRLKAFTLAEVLITLGIIGVVAAMTMPALIGKYKEKQTITAVKVVYSTFSQAFLQLVNDYGSFSTLALNSYEENSDSPAELKENANITINALSKYIKTLKTCDKKSNCMSPTYKSLDGSHSHNWDSYPNIQTGILANGTAFWILNNCGNNNELDDECAQLGFDINGTSKPNVIGEDFFWFSIYNNGKIRILDKDILDKQCDKQSQHEFNGYFCASYIMIYENMDYLKN